jgi:hypothetical protein
MEYLSKHPGDAATAQKLVKEIRKTLETGIEVTLTDLETIVIQSIKWEDLTPQKKLVVTTLLMMVQQQVTIKIDDGILDENERIFAAEFLTWIEQAIFMSGVMT